MYCHSNAIYLEASTAKAPTSEQFKAYQSMFDYFNRKLFGSRLPSVLLNFSRHRGAYGFFAPWRWATGDGQTIKHEISLNPTYMRGRSVQDLASTLVHEMVHLEQQTFGRPGAGGYHNREWADWMERVGLMPSDTGQPGGSRTGKHLSHWIVDGGPFAKAFDARYSKGSGLWPWRAQEAPATGGANKKFRYTCPACGTNAWGKSSLMMICGLDGQWMEVSG